LLGWLHSSWVNFVLKLFSALPILEKNGKIRDLFSSTLAVLESRKMCHLNVIRDHFNFRTSPFYTDIQKLFNNLARVSGSLTALKQNDKVELNGEKIKQIFYLLPGSSSRA